MKRNYSKDRFNMWAFSRFVMIASTYCATVGYYVPPMLTDYYSMGVDSVILTLLAIGLYVPIIEMYYYYKPKITGNNDN